MTEPAPIPEALAALTPLDRESVLYTLHEDASLAGDGTPMEAAFDELARIVKASGLVAGRCRICDCDEEHACSIVTPRSDAGAAFPGHFGQRACGWADETQTLCDNPNCLAKAAEAPSEVEDQRLRRYGPGYCPRAAVDEVMGPEGPGPFPPTYRTEGGSTRPVVHSEEAAIDRERCTCNDSRVSGIYGACPVHGPLAASIAAGVTAGGGC